MRPARATGSRLEPRYRCEAWLAQPVYAVVEPTPRHVDVLAGLLAETGTAANLANDAHLTALALEHDAVLISFDSDFGWFAGPRREVPTG